MSVIHAPQKPELDVRYTLFLGLSAAGLLGIFLRLWYVQVVQSEQLMAQAERARRSSVEKLAPRGLIFDRNRQLVAGVRPQSVITAIYRDVKKEPWVITKVANLLGIDEKKLWRKVDDGVVRPYLPTPIYADVPIELASKLAEAGPDLPGIGVETQPMRYYPNTADLAHVLGYVWTPSQRDLDRLKPELEKSKRKPAAYVGKNGIERIYETQLMGEPGSESLEVDNHRRPVRVVGRDPATPGKRLVLTIDRDLQKYANAVLGQYVATKPDSGGAVVALDPRNGEVLALVSMPTYDASKFIGGISNSEYEALTSDPRKPLFNRAIAGALSPGSTFKIVTTLAAVRAGIFDPNRTTFCGGAYTMGRQRLKCTGSHGAVGFQRAMAQSCNVYFCDLGVRVGRERLVETAMEFGLGRRTQIDLVGESRGSVPTEAWIRAVQKKREDEAIQWFQGNQANISIGQGDITTTPLQMANAIAMVANRGKQYQPHLVRQIGDQAVQPKLFHEIDAPAEVWDLLLQSLVGVIEHGTARRTAYINGIRWGGKTGSTEHGRVKGSRTHSWFVGYAPADNPKIAIAVLAEKAGHGGEVAAPIAAAVVKRYLTTLSERERKAASNAGRNSAPPE